MKDNYENKSSYRSKQKDCIIQTCEKCGKEFKSTGILYGQCDKCIEASRNKLITGAYNRRTE